MFKYIFLFYFIRETISIETLIKDNLGKQKNLFFIFESSN